MDIDYVELYRLSGSIDDFVRLVTDAGGDSEEAVAMYEELNYKYGEQ